MWPLQIPAAAHTQICSLDHAWTMELQLEATTKGVVKSLPPRIRISYAFSTLTSGALLAFWPRLQPVPYFAASQQKKAPFLGPQSKEALAEGSGMAIAGAACAEQAAWVDGSRTMQEEGPDHWL